ncbi:MAG: glycosyltransferase family 4 protein [Planctomycetes bacterium]|nr:glycosyltransferase family 4 protein [Planctomycetota bacterium]
MARTVRKKSFAAPVRVLFLSAEGLMGGAERSLYELLCALPEDRVAAHACVPPEGPLARLFALAEVPVHPVPLRRFRRTLHPFLLAGQVRALYQASRILVEIVRVYGIQILHANTDSSALVAWEVSRETGIPMLWHCRDLRPLGPLARILAARSAHAIAISRAVAEHLRQQGLASRKIKTVLNGIDLARCHAPSERDAIRRRTRAYLGVPEDVPLLIDVGGWVPWKRHELFLEALAAVREKHPRARGLLVGSDLFSQNPSYARLLEARAAALKLDDEALLVLQQRDDVPDLLAASDLLVAPSDREPFGRVLAEAGASGLPVVATDSGGKREIIKDGQTGYLTKPGDAQALARGCVKLLDDPAKLAKFGEKARARIEKHFDIRRTAEEVAELYERIAAGGGK